MIDNDMASGKGICCPHFPGWGTWEDPIAEVREAMAWEAERKRTQGELLKYFGVDTVEEIPPLLLDQLVERLETTEAKTPEESMLLWQAILANVGRKEGEVQ